MKSYKSVNRLWERDRRTDNEVSGFITCKPIQLLIQRFRDFCQKKLPDFNTSATRHLAAEMPKKAFALPIFMLFYAQSYAFIDSKHSDYTAKA
ncbi:hypothetical protein C3V39_11430 [Prevotella sp. oral taxon 820]|uniref:hypothetical protein n=1 Tax=Prevotella sp. oral taxon 820 TaxID=2081962 RepID=UPI000D1F787D|nr:hypothetical protein [Prevotella sp. oral taxon 820]PTL25281.1 hypothetical protein C3V39_11430 [Prevotella sp. oral taxon 820]